MGVHWVSYILWLSVCLFQDRPGHNAARRRMKDCMCVSVCVWERSLSWWPNESNATINNLVSFDFLCPLSKSLSTSLSLAYSSVLNPNEVPCCRLPTSWLKWNQVTDLKCSSYTATLHARRLDFLLGRFKLTHNWFQWSSIVSKRPLIQQTWLHFCKMHVRKCFRQHFWTLNQTNHAFFKRRS